MLKRGSYIPRSSRFLRYVDQNSKTRKFLRHSIDKGDDLKQYEADNEAMNLIFISIPNDIYNSIDACQNARDIWNIVKRLMQGTELSETEREPRFVNEFDKFTAELRESLSSPEWYKYVTNVRLEKDLKKDTYDMLFDHLQQYESLANASRGKRAAKTHDPLALVANTYASSSSSRSPAAYYVTHPPYVVDYDDDYQGDAICDDQEDSLITAMMLLARAITQRYTNKQPSSHLFEHKELSSCAS
ncbi:hypothetical protein Tco_0676943 [Tanacetum coccineum]